MQQASLPVVHAFTVKYKGITNRITTAVKLSVAFDPESPPDPSPSLVETNALWDTGATNSVVTSATAQQLGLVPVGTTKVNHAGGSSQSNTFLVNILLPNRVGVVGVLVSECDNIVGDFGAIIGMDIIAKGDLSITNVDERTWVSFCLPSIHSVDYVAEVDRAKFAGVARNAPCPCGKKDENGKPIKFKHCHGKVVTNRT